VSCEAFYTEKELDEAKHCPVHGTPTTWESEENVFFRLSKYADALLDHYRRHPDFVRPETRLAEVVSFVRSGLSDLSVSRSKVKWGIPFPGRGGVVYVWLDALSNYITALGFGSANPALYREFWENADGRRIHVIGKDILRFHAVYWPAFLLSAGLPLPTTVWAHGWWLRDEKKMSKSVGNVVRPDRLIEQFGPDALRYFLLREMTFGQDARFSDEAFLTRYNADLANDLGNTVSRVAALCRQSYGGTPPEACRDDELVAAFETALAEWRSALESFAFSRALEVIWKLLSEINGYIVAREPWKIRKEEGVGGRLSRVLYGSAEAVRLAGVMIWPFAPYTARRLFEAVGAPPTDPTSRDLDWGGLPAGKAVPETPPLFPRADTAAYFEERKDAMTETAQGTPPPSDERIGIEEFQKIRLVTGKILAAERVPKSNKLVKLEVDIGTEKRQVVAGIAAVYAPEILVGRSVVIVANLKPATLMGVESNGMVLAATVGEKGEPALLEVPENAPPGSKVK
jgi:methionyl-tRNA synthetase